MSRKRRSAFTVVEMLVVITIIALLAGLLLPAVQAARETGRRINCVSNIKQAAMAGVAYTSRHQYLPPSRSWATKAMGPNNAFPPVGGIDETLAFSWVQKLLNDLDQPNVAAELDALPNPGLQAQFGPRLPVLMCPSETHEEEGQAAFDYAINAGRINDTYNTFANHDWKANGGSADELRRLVDTQDHRRNCRISMSDLTDGAGNTIAFAENLYLRTWCVTPASGVNAMTEFHSGVIWDPAGIGFPPIDETASVNGGAIYAYPISRHPGGFNLAMWDGSARYVSNTIDYSVYARLMTSDGRRIQHPASGAAEPQQPSLSGTEW